MKEVFLAVDFGGGSGRVIAGYVANGNIEIEEVHRFGNRQVTLGGRVYWDFLSLFADMKEGISRAVDKQMKIKGIAIDTWGVDFGFIDQNGHLIGNPVCYRDSRTEGVSAKFISSVGNAAWHYAKAGIQVMDINSIYQLISMKQEGNPILDAAHKLLFMPDLFSYFLTGEANTEYTIASTSELLDAEARQWNWQLIDSLGLRRELFCPIVQPGTVRGMLKGDVAEELGIDYEVPVIAVGSHDTASAVYATTLTESEEDSHTSAFLSSGTWSLLGIQLDKPILSEKAMQCGFSNEGGVGGKYYFLQNITGLWILQRLVAQWHAADGIKPEYGDLVDAARAANYDGTIDVDDASFQNPADMEKAIADYCVAQGFAAPANRGEVVLCVLKSLAARYKKGIDGLNTLLDAPITKLNIIGGGSKNALLNELTQEAIGVPVVAGAGEATAIGNILSQVRCCQPNSL